MLLLLPLVTFAQAGVPCTPTQSPANAAPGLCNPFGSSVENPKLDPVNDFKSLLFRLLIVFASFTALVPVVIIVAAGFQMIIAHGNAEAIQRAKTALSYAVYGFIMAVLSFVLVAGMADYLGANNLPDPSNPANDILANPLVDKTFGDLVINKILINFLKLAGLLAILMLVFNGFRYITASGDEEQIKEAKDAMKWIAAGIITILFAYVIIKSTANLIFP